MYYRLTYKNCICTKTILAYYIQRRALGSLQKAQVYLKTIRWIVKHLVEMHSVSCRIQYQYTCIIEEVDLIKYASFGCLNHLSHIKLDLGHFLNNHSWLHKFTLHNRQLYIYFSLKKLCLLLRFKIMVLRSGTIFDTKSGYSVQYIL